MRIERGDAPSGDLTIHYEDLGDIGDPVVLLVMGLGAQLTFWRDGFVERIVDRGFRVVRFDNRDAGLSTHLRGVRTKGSQLGNMARSVLGVRSPSVYTLEDMADDAAALLDHLGIARAHVVGASMGGMIAQVFAARHASRTRSLGVIFSSNNQPLLPPPGPRQLLAVTTGPKADAPRDVVIANSVRVTRLIGGRAYQRDDEVLRADAAAYYDRAHDPGGVARQFNAIVGSGSIRHHDVRITVPTVVLHGTADRLMRLSGGRAVAAAIPGARLVTYDGMGHDLPEALWDDIVGELATTFAAATASGEA